MRGGRLAALAGSGLLALAIAAAALALQLVRTSDHAQRWLGRTVGALASTPDGAVTVERIGGDLLSAITLDRIAVADREGTWATLDHVDIRWTFTDLLVGRLTLHEVHAGRLDLLRPPASRADTSSGGGARLPIAVALGRLTVDRVALAAPLIGEPATLSLRAEAQARPGWRDIAAALSAQRIDGHDGGLTLRVHRPTADAGLVLALDYREPADGLLARLLALPGLPALSLTLDGAGPEADWHGRVAANAEGLGRLDAALAVALTDRLAVTLDGGAEITGLLPPSLQAALGRVTTLTLRAERASDGTLDLTHATFGAGLGTVTLSGRVQPTLDLTATAALSRLALLSDAAAMPLDGAVRVSLHATGDPTAPTIATELTSDRLTAGPHTVAGLATTVTSTPSAGATIAGTIARLETAGTPPLAPVSWHIDAKPDGSDQIVVSRLEINTPLLTVGGSATLGLSDQQLAATLSLTAADLGLWRSLTGLELAGRTTADLTIAGTLERGLDADVSLHATDLVTHQPIADALLGHRLDGTLHALRRRDGTIALAPIELKAADLTVRGRGELLADGSARSTLQLALPRLAPLGQAAGAALQGDASATVEIDRTGATTRGQLRADAHLNGVAARLTSRFALEPARLTIDGMRLDAAAASLSGGARVALPSGLADGAFSLAAADLSGLSALAGMPLAGRLQGRIQLADERGAQRAALTLDATNLKSGDARIAKATVSAALSDLARAPRGRATATVADAGSGGAATLGRATVTADGTLDQLSWSITAQGQATQRFTVEARGQTSRGGGAERLAVQTLVGQFGTLPIRLAQPTALQRTTGALVIEPLKLELGKGRLQLAASRRGEQLAGTLDIQDLPLGLTRLVAPAIKLDGQLDARARVGGTRAAPDANVAVTVRRAMLAGNPVPIDGDITAGWHDGQAALQSRITGLGDQPLVATARLPIAYQAEPFDIGLAPAAALDVRVHGPIDLRRSLDLAGVDEPVRGRATVDLAVAGTVARPQVTGTAELADGRYADASIGVTVDAIAAKLVGSGSRIELATLTATDGAAGRLTGRGAIDLAAAAPAFEGTADITGFAIHRDEGTATADGAVRFGGSGAGGHVDGTITIQKADLAIPDRLPTTLVSLDVIEINTGKPVPQRADAPSPTEAALPIRLGLAVTMPGQILVHGRGLDSEWRGRLTVGGSAARPDIQGRLSLVRGRLDFLGRMLTLSDGTIAFPGGTALEPTIDITASAATSDLTATIKLTGTAGKPTLTLTSDPPLPQDEILARVLFDKTVDQLSAAQAIQLAQSVATLTGGGGNSIIDRLRKATGLDVINVQPGQSQSGTDPSGSALNVGKYISNRVLVTGEQGLTTSSSRAGVEVNVTDHVTVKTSVGAAADSNIGLNWKLDY